MYAPIPPADIHSAFNNSRYADALYQAIAEQFDKPEYLVEPEQVEIRRAYTQIVRILRCGIDWEIQRDFDVELNHIDVALSALKRPSKRRDAIQACHDDLVQVQEDIHAIYEQAHAWDD